MTTIDELFTQLASRGRKALMPFITAGDPDLEFSAAVLQEFARRGCSLCELGIPYSDPIADGPVIQESYTRALAHKIKLAEIVEMLGRASGTLSPGGRGQGEGEKSIVPLVTMVSYAIVYRHGLQRYVDDMQAPEWPGRSCPICWSRNRRRWPKSAVRPISV